MSYESIITLSVMEKTRISTYNLDGTKQQEHEIPRIITHTKRIINLPKECTLPRGKYHLLLSSGDFPADIQWRQGFSELYLFFKEVMTLIAIIVTTQAGRELWNKTLQKRNLELVSNLGRQVPL
jgi:hypothetical protein